MKGLKSLEITFASKSNWKIFLDLKSTLFFSRLDSFNGDLDQNKQTKMPLFVAVDG